MSSSVLAHSVSDNLFTYTQSAVPKDKSPAGATDQQPDSSATDPTTPSLEIVPVTELAEPEPPVREIAPAIDRPVATRYKPQDVASQNPVKKAARTEPEEPQEPMASLIDDKTDKSDTAFLKSFARADTLLVRNTAGATDGALIGDPIGISESVAFALRNNFEIQAGEEKTYGAYWDKVGAYSEYLPSVQVSKSHGVEHSTPAAYNDQFGNRVANDSHIRNDHDLTIQQPVIDLAIISDILSAGDKHNIAKLDQKDVREGIAADTASTFLKLLEARITVYLTDQYKGYLDNLAVRMQARVKGGGGTQADLERVKSRSEALENARIAAAGEYETEMAEYTRLTRVTPSQIKIPDVLAPPVPDDMQEALDASFKANPSYRSSLKKIDEAADARDKSFSGLLPKLSVQYDNQYTYDAGGSAKGNPVDGVYPNQNTQALMLVARWSINGGTEIAGGISDMAKMREMGLRSADVHARLEQGIRSSYTAINAAKARSAALQRSVESSERVVRDFEKQFKYGNRSLFDVLDAYEQLYNARVSLMRVIVAKAQALYLVQRQMGDLIPSIIREERKE